MRKFIAHIFLFILVPFVVLVATYLITDPYRTLRPFSLEYFDDTNRDYLSSELFLMNYPSHHYDSYIFGSSRGCGINTYHWLKYLPKGSKQFLFQGWGETLTGIEQKITYIDKIGGKLNNVIILLDNPGSFGDIQTPKEALSIKHPTFSGQSVLLYQSILFYDFLQKPSQWLRAVQKFVNNRNPHVEFDTVSNDWNAENKEVDLSIPPQKDSLKNCSEISREVFMKGIDGKTESDVQVSSPLINKRFERQLRHIKVFFDRQGTDYRIVVTPGYCYNSLVLNRDDKRILEEIFGKDNVYDYTGYNCLNSDYNNYSDPGHFGLYVGWYIIEDMYGDNHLARSN